MRLNTSIVAVNAASLTRFARASPSPDRTFVPFTMGSSLSNALICVWEGRSHH